MDSILSILSETRAVFHRTSRVQYKSLNDESNVYFLEIVLSFGEFLYVKYTYIPSTQ